MLSFTDLNIILGLYLYVSFSIYYRCTDPYFNILIFYEYFKTHHYNAVSESDLEIRKL